MVRFRPVETRKHLSGQWICVWAWVIVTLVGILLTPSGDGHGTHRQLGLPPCAAVAMFGRPCPGCGLTTSWTAVLHGQWSAAWQAHPLGLAMYLGFTGMALLAAYGLVKMQAVHITRFSQNLLYVLVGLYVLYGGFRFVNPPDTYTKRPMYGNVPVSQGPR